MSSPHRRESLQHQTTDVYQTDGTTAPGWRRHCRSVNTIWPPVLEMKLAQLSLSSSSAVEGTGEQGTTDSSSNSDSDSDSDTFPATTAGTTDVEDEASSKSTKRKRSSSSSKEVQRLLQIHGPFKTSCIIPAAPRLNLHDHDKAEKPADLPSDQVDADGDDETMQSDDGVDNRLVFHRQSSTHVDRAAHATGEAGSRPLDSVTTTASLTTQSRRRNFKSKSYHISVHPWSLPSITYTDGGDDSGHSSGDDNSSSSSSIHAKDSGRTERPFSRLRHRHAPPPMRRRSYSFCSKEYRVNGSVENRRHSSSSVLSVNPVNTFLSSRRSSVQRRRGGNDSGGQVFSITPPPSVVDPSPASPLSASMPSAHRLSFAMTAMKATTTSSTPGSDFRISTASSRSSTPAFVYKYTSASSSIGSPPAVSRRKSVTSALTSSQTFILQGFLARHSNGHQLFRRPSRKCCPDDSAWLGELGQDSSASCCYSSTECERDGDDEDEDEDEEDKEEEDERFLLLAQSPNSSEFDLRDFFDRELEKKAKSHQADSPVFFHGFPLLRMTPLDR